MASIDDILENIASLSSVPEDELDEEQKKERDELLAQLADATKDKVDGTARFIRLSAAQAEVLKKESQYLAKRAKALENSIERLKGFYLLSMKKRDLSEIAGAVYKIKVTKSEAVDVFDEELLADKMPNLVNVKVTRAPDKKLIKDALKNGEEVPGARLEHRENLRIS